MWRIRNKVWLEKKNLTKPNFFWKEVGTIDNIYMHNHLVVRNQKRFIAILAIL